MSKAWNSASWEKPYILGDRSQKNLKQRLVMLVGNVAMPL